MNTTRGEKYHIHIDAEWIDPRLSHDLIDGHEFQEKGFIRDGGRGSENSPALHLTKKYWDRAIFDADFDFILASINNGRRLRGYVEGEFIAFDRDFAVAPSPSQIRAPFRASVARLPTGTFRQTELHLTVSTSESDPRALETLFEMGLFCAYALKDYGRAQIYTIQGTVRKIAAITPLLVEFVENGGLGRPRLKEERIVRWWVSDDAIVLPPTVSEIEFLVPALAPQTVATRSFG